MSLPPTYAPEITKGGEKRLAGVNGRLPGGAHPPGQWKPQRQWLRHRMVRRALRHFRVVVVFPSRRNSMSQTGTHPDIGTPNHAQRRNS